MPKNGHQNPFPHAHRLALAAFLLVFPGIIRPAFAQDNRLSRDYSRANSFGFFIAYSNNSSHMLLGDAERRKLLELGASYNRRLRNGRNVNWQYSAEFLPFALESDPLSLYVNSQTSPTVTSNNTPGSPPISCTPISDNYSIPGSGGVTYIGTASFSCQGRRWTVGEAVSPIGMQWNFRPARKLQPFFNWHGGYMYSSRQIPINSAGSRNFTFDAGAGIELYRTQTQSVSVEFCFHHISNGDSAQLNPGIDNGMIQASYSFGR